MWKVKWEHLCVDWYGHLHIHRTLVILSFSQNYHNILLSYHIFICLWHQLCVTQISCFQFLYIESCLGVTECLLFAKWIRVKTSMFGLYHSDQCPTLLSDYSNQEQIIHTCFCVCNNVINVFIYFFNKENKLITH